MPSSGISEVEKEVEAVHLVTSKGKGHVLTMLFRACFNFRNPKRKQLGILTKEEREIAHNYLIRQDQEKTFSREITAARENN